MTKLFVIEAPGKAQAFRETLLKIGIEAKVQATRGHLYQMPSRLTPVGIDSAYREFERLPIDIEIVERLRLEAKEASEIFIATDADHEGDVIAWDVFETIRDLHPYCRRVKLKGMDEDGIRDAIENAGEVTKRDAVAGRTRAIVDRMIGATFSRNGVAVGRVGTALLGLVAKTTPTTIKLHLSAPSASGGRPFSAECDAVRPITEDVARKLASLTFPALDVRDVAPASVAPAHTGDVMVGVGDRLDMSPMETQKSMQNLYEAGRLSYPRSGARSISTGTAMKIAEIFKDAGYTQCSTGQWVMKGEEDVHDAPHPIGKVDPAANPRKLGCDEGVRTLIARDLVRAGLPRTKESPRLEKIAAFLRGKGFPDAVVTKICSLDWSREVGPRFPGEESWPKSRIEVRRADTVLLEKAVEVQLGRASTYPSHIENFMKRGLVDEDLGLTRKGEEWVASSPPALLDPKISALIEKACEKFPEQIMSNDDREPWELNAQRIIEHMPEAIRVPLMKSIANEPEHPKIDPLDLVSDRQDSAFDIDALLEDRPTYAPRPSENLY